LPEIEQLLKDAGLEFIGFELLEPNTINNYRKSYPDDIQCTNLKNWHRFEQANKDVFIGMYIMWCRKADREDRPAH
jgi:hypothetical protein